VLLVLSNRDERVRPPRDLIHRTLWYVLLRNDAIRAQNAGATHQCCMLRCFGNLVVRNIEVCVDDIESQRTRDLVTNLKLTFEKLQANDIKLNPEKMIEPSLWM
jgi:hypothetical protein